MKHILVLFMLLVSCKNSVVLDEYYIYDSAIHSEYWYFSSDGHIYYFSHHDLYQRWAEGYYHERNGTYEIVEKEIYLDSALIDTVVYDTGELTIKINWRKVQPFFNKESVKVTDLNTENKVLNIEFRDFIGPGFYFVDHPLMQDVIIHTQKTTGLDIVIGQNSTRGMFQKQIQLNLTGEESYLELTYYPDFISMKYGGLCDKYILKKDELICLGKRWRYKKDVSIVKPFKLE